MSNKKSHKKILQMCSYLPQNPFHRQFFEAMAGQSAHQLVTCPHFVPENNIPRSPSIDNYFGSQKKWSYVRKLCYSLKIRDYTEHVSNFVNPESIELIHAHSLFADGLTAHKVSLKHHIPLIITIRDSDIGTFPKYYPHWRKKAREALHDAKKIIFVNPNFRSYLERALKIKLNDSQCNVIPNGVDNSWLSAPFRSDLQKPLLKILCVGKISDRKNQKALIKSVVRARDLTGLPYTLDLAGNSIGKYGQDVLNLCEKHTFVNYLGVLQQDELMDILITYDIFALPSHTENFGIVYAEALCCGIPIIYSRGQGFDGWSDTFCYGLPVCSNDQESITNAIVNMDTLDFSPKKLKEFSNKLYSWNSISQSHKLIYDQIKHINEANNKS